ncbi:hypothetical protein D3C74_318640 [compost metagenome]
MARNGFKPFSQTILLEDHLHQISLMRNNSNVWFRIAPRYPFVSENVITTVPVSCRASFLHSKACILGDLLPLHLSDSAKHLRRKVTLCGVNFYRLGQTHPADIVLFENLQYFELIHQVPCEPIQLPRDDGVESSLFRVRQ